MAEQLLDVAKYHFHRAVRTRLTTFRTSMTRAYSDSVISVVSGGTNRQTPLLGFAELTRLESEELQIFRYRR